MAALEVIMGVYSITNTKNNKIYVGSSLNVPRRLLEHKKFLNKGTHYNNHLQAAYNTDKDFFEFSHIVATKNQQDSLQIEQDFIENLNLVSCGYNLSKFAVTRLPDSKKRTYAMTAQHKSNILKARDEGNIMQKRWATFPPKYIYDKKSKVFVGKWEGSLTRLTELTGWTIGGIGRCLASSRQSYRGLIFSYTELKTTEKLC